MIGIGRRNTPEFAGTHTETGTDFEFHGEMLNTVEGRTAIFREMVRMFNEVRKKRDELGFGEERDAEGNLEHKAYRNLKNDDFDGFLSFRRRYNMLKEKIAEYSNRGAERDQEGKITGTKALIDLSDEEASDFEKGFGFLRSYYSRTEKFQKADEAESPLITSEAETEATPSVVAENPHEEQMPAEPEVEVPKAYEERLAIRTAWKEKKSVFETEYKMHLEKERARKQSLMSKFAFWKKEEKPESLLAAEASYQDARRAYAESLDQALLSKKVGTLTSREDDAYTPEEKIPALRAALANRFVLHAAHDKLRLEKEYLPNEQSLRVFDDLQKSLKKHRFLIRAGGYAIVTGVGLATGGVAAAVIALSGKAVQAKVSAAFMAGGATLGAALGNNVSDSIISYQERRRNASAQNAQHSFNVENLESLEEDYLKRYRGHEQAVRNKKYIIAGGAIAGGALGAVVAGSLDDIANIPDVPDAPVPPEDIPEVPVPEEPVVPIIEPPLEEIPEPEVQTPDTEFEHHEKDISNFPKDDDFKTESHDTESVPPEEIEEDVPETPELLYTFEPGSRTDTVSEALFESWKADHNLLDENLSKKEFLAQMYGAIAEVEKDPSLNDTLLEQMGITSGDIDEVQAGQTINLQPFFDYLNNKQ